MDWFHCNNCFLRKGKNFVVSSCGHVFCESCVNPNHCSVCRATCNFLPISDKMKPQEQMFFRNPTNLIQTRLEHIAQIALFQNKQKERVIAFHKHKCAELERRLKEMSEQCYRQVSELKKENSELKKPLSQRKTSPVKLQANGCYPRMTLPVAVTTPVTPRVRTVSSHPGSGDTMDRFRTSRPIMANSPGLATPVSSIHEHGFRTPSSANTPFLRADRITPTIFQFQLMPRPTIQSPQPWNV